MVGDFGWLNYMRLKVVGAKSDVGGYLYTTAQTCNGVYLVGTFIIIEVLYSATGRGLL